MGQYNATGYETLAISNSAVSLSASTIGTGRSFVGRLQGAQVRARSDGTAPTTSEGVPIEVGDVIVLSQHEIAATQFIRTTSTDAALKGHYYSIDPTAFSGGGFA
jgi:hypothetical protein